MCKRMMGLIVGILMAWGGVGTGSAIAATNAPPAAKSRHRTSKTHWTSFQGTIKTVDKVAMTFTVTNKRGERTFQITSQTRLFKGGKPAISEEATPGEVVRGRARQAADGKWVASLIRLGPPTAVDKQPRKRKPPPADSK
jgi:Domain of unknown function (DUF5666)